MKKKFLLCGSILMVLLASITVSTPSLGYSFFPTPTAWDPGPNTARIGGFPAPGGATWSIMPSGMSDASGFDSKHTGVTGNIDCLIPPCGDSLEATLFNDALNVWAAASGFTNLGQVDDGGAGAGASEPAGGHLGDIRIAAWELSTPGVIAHAFQPATESLVSGGSIGGDIHFDIGRSWSDNPDAIVADPEIDLFTVALHEIGHALGLGHSDIPGSVMEPIYAGARRTLSDDDINGITAIYGPDVSASNPSGTSGAGLPGGGVAATPLPPSFGLALLGFSVIMVFARRSV